MTDNTLTAIAAEERQGETRDTPLSHLSIDHDARITLTIQQLIGKSINIVGLKRSGKTNTGAVLAEEWLDHGLPMTVVDRQNEWWGLAQAYPFIIAGRGKKATTQLDVAHAADLAEFSFANRISVILSLLRYEEEEQWDILQAYFERLLELAEAAFDEERSEPYALVLEEARTYLPLQVKTPVKRVLKEVILGGGKLGLTTLLLNQRLAGCDTDCASQADYYFLHRVAHPRDRMIYKEIIPLPPKEVDCMINGLSTGEAIFVSGGLVVAANIREQTTHHAGATPHYSPGERVRRGALDLGVLARAQALMTSEVQERRDPSPEYLADCTDAPCRAAVQPVSALLSLLSSHASPATLAQLVGEEEMDGDMGSAPALLYLSQIALILSQRKAFPMTTSMTVPSDSKRTGNMLVDQEGQSHTVVCSDQRFQIDGQEASIIAIDQQQVTISCAAGTIVVTTADFWSAIVGDADPTREDGGMLLAQNIARWAAGRQQREVIQRWLEQGQGLETLCLPPLHLDPVTRALLEAAISDGSEEGQRAVVYMLQRRHPHGRVAELLQQVGLQMADLRGEATREDRGSGSAGANGAHPAKSDRPARGAGASRKRAHPQSGGQFQWTPDMAADLEREFMDSQAEAVSEAAREIAERHGWPVDRVSYKLWYMKLPEKKKQAAQQATNPASEEISDDREETHTEGAEPDKAGSF
jgi:hypothetical protein